MLRVLLVPIVAAVLLWTKWDLLRSPPPVLDVRAVELSGPQMTSLSELNLTVRNPIKIGGKTIHGRFLHITDIHPDPYYKAGSSVDEMCHSGNGDAGKYGDAILGCDSPPALMNETLEWINTHLKDKIDFIVWTGDNVRHDNDRRYPRTETHIFDMNGQVSTKMHELFRTPDAGDPRDMVVDLIPSLGNNDVYPHNLFAPGPTLQTRELYMIWNNFIPPEQLHTFNRGAYFFKEVIPNQLAVLSINTLYWFQSNPLVDNCDSRKEPGYKLFVWLGVVLKEMRARNMKVWLSGHVPPNEKNFDVSCLRKYVLWTHEYRDVIVGGLYGHMNIDHFIPLDARAAYKSLKDSLKKKKGKKGKKRKGKKKDLEIEIPDFTIEYFSDDDELDSDYELDADDYAYYQQPPMKITGGVPNNKVSYLESLRETYYAAIKGRRKSGVDSERYSIAHVSASVIPTFNPGLRVWEYNTTGLEESVKAAGRFAPWPEFFAGVTKLMDSLSEDDDVHALRKKDKTVPPKKPAHIPLGPAYTPQLFTPTRYTQYYVDLAKVNAGDKKFGFEFEYNTDDDYGMSSLLVKEWLKLGRKLGAPIKDPKKNDPKKSKKLSAIWHSYLKHAFVDSNYENLGYG